MKAVSITMKEQLYERLKTVSKEENRSMADWSRILIEKEIIKQEQKDNEH